MNEVMMIGALLSGAAVLLAVLFHRIHSSRGRFEVDAGWWKEFDPSRYTPVARLLDEDDLQYLRSLDGYDRRLEKDLRRRRTQIFNAYLGEMVQDFERLQVLGKLMVMAGGSPLLREQLFLQKLAFSRALIVVRCQVFAFRLGIGRVDARGLVESFRTAASAMQATLPAAAAA